MIKSRKRSVKKSRSKRKLNAYFKKMLEAKTMFQETGDKRYEKDISTNHKKSHIYFSC